MPDDGFFEFGELGTGMLTGDHAEFPSRVDMRDLDAIETHRTGAVIFPHGREKDGGQLAAVIKIAQCLRDLGAAELAS